MQSRGVVCTTDRRVAGNILDALESFGADPGGHLEWADPSTMATTGASDPSRKTAGAAEQRKGVEGVEGVGASDSGEGAAVGMAGSTGGRGESAAGEPAAGGPQLRRLYPIGRLDAESTGIILLTSNGGEGAC